jgi:uncharacterized NAD(P)/FAD-binding protein YdhS
MPIPTPDDEQRIDDMVRQRQHNREEALMLRMQEANAEVMGDLRGFDETIKLVRNELLDEAMSQNLKRPHHLESAIAAFEDMRLLDKASKIVHELLEPDLEETVPAQGNEYPQDF